MHAYIHTYIHTYMYIMYMGVSYVVTQGFMDLWFRAYLAAVENETRKRFFVGTEVYDRVYVGFHVSLGRVCLESDFLGSELQVLRRFKA